MMNNPRFLITLCLILMLSGLVLPLLIVIHVIPSTFLLNFLSWGLSVSGFFLGFVGISMLEREG